MLICDSENMVRVQNILQQTSVQSMVIMLGNVGDHSLESLVEKTSLICSVEEEKQLSSCGRPIIISQVKIVDEEGREIPAGPVGEIVTRGPYMMKGYWKMEEETEETIRNGWLHTGDMAY